MADTNNPLIHLQFTEEFTADLRGRQSVRTTFKLSERAIEALSILAGQLGIKQKSLFDQLIADTQALRIIAREAEDFGDRMQRIAKTYVVSRRTLENLERISNQYHTPRDALVEYSIERILPLLAREKEKHDRRKQLLASLEQYLQEGSALLDRAVRELGEEDGSCLDLFHAVRQVEHCCRELGLKVAKGSKLEEF